MAEYSDDSLGSFLDAQPPHWAARGLAHLLVLIFLTAVLLSVAMPVPDIVSCPFTLIPVRGMDPIRTPQDGTICDLRVHDGQRVAQGDRLFAVRSDEIGRRSSEFAGLAVGIQTARQDLDTEMAGFSSQQRAAAAEGKRLEETIQSLTQSIDKFLEIKQRDVQLHRTNLELARRDLDRLRNKVPLQKKKWAVAQKNVARSADLYKSMATTEVVLVAHQLELDQTTLELKEAQSAVDDALLKQNQMVEQNQRQRAQSELMVMQLSRQLKVQESELAKLNHQREVDQRAHDIAVRSLQETIQKDELRRAALKQELRDSAGDTLQVRAPCAGTVIRLHVRNNGAVVKSGELVCEMARDRDRLRAELSVPGTGAGRIKTDMAVRLKYDAFPYQRYGTRHGVITRVSSSRDRSIRAHVQIKDAAFVAGGRRRRLIPGMTGRADVVVDRQPLLVYFLQPFRALAETSRDVPDGSS